MIPANRLVKTLKEKGLTLALAESVTCGMAADRLARFKGTSDVLAGSVVCYTPEVKCASLGVPKKLIDKYTCESMQVTEAMIGGLKKLMKADIYASVTGLASVGGSETKTKPVGTVFFCVRHGDKLYRERKVFRGTPLEIRKKACLYLYQMILDKV